MRVYWKSMAEMYIPLSLLESTMNSKNQIFDAISLEGLRSLMRQSFSDENFVEPFSIYSMFTLNTRVNAVEEALSGGRPRIKAEVLFTKLQLNMTPNKLSDLISSMEYVDNVKIAEDLQQFRPTRRPITTRRKNESERYKKKRFMIVRDWFFYGLWAIRLKKAMKKSKKPKKKDNNKLNELEKLYDKINDEVKDTNKRKNLSDFMKNMKSRIDAEVAKKEEKLIELQKKIMGVKVTARYQEFTLKVYSNNSKDPIITYQIIVRSFPIFIESCT